MVFYLIGLGLGDEKDITVKGLETLRACDKVYLEAYTSILGVDRLKLEAFYQKEVIEADRETCETGIDKILEDLAKAPEQKIAFLVVGDPFCATTHSDVYLRAIELGITVEVIHNASIVNAIGCTGMQVYRFGEIVSMPYFTEKWRPYSFYERVLNNRKNNLHTLVLLDIKVKERSEENILKNKKVYEPPRFMDCKTCVEQLLEAEENLKKDAYSPASRCVGVARVGMTGQRIVSGEMKQFLDIDMGPPLHSFIICADELHPIEQDMYKHFAAQQ